MSDRLRVLVAGCGHIGAVHARAYHALPDFELAGLVARRPEGRDGLAAELGGPPVFSDFAAALAATRPDAVCIATYPDTHAPFARAALAAGAHVFVEKPLADTLAAAESAVQASRAAGRTLVVGYILRHHPGWVRFIELAHGLGRPLALRISQNQQSTGAHWERQRGMMASTPPIVDCGVHYVDVWCQIAPSRPVRVHAIGARLSGDLPEGMYNYGQLQVAFEDGSVGWYEAGWGPMMSETAYFVKDVIGPKGSVSIVRAPEAGAVRSDEVNAHTQTNQLLLHHAELGPDGSLARGDERFSTADEPTHDDLCEREQRFLLRAIAEDVDLTAHMNDAVRSLRIVLGADRAVRTGEVVRL